MQRNPNWLPGIRKMAVLRANALGDFIYALPALEALRAAYPETEIVLLGQRWHAECLANRPAPVDRVLVVPWSRGVAMPNRFEAEHWQEDPAELDAFFRQAQAEQFDLAIQLHGGGGNSNPFLLRLGAKFNAGMRTLDAPSLDRNMHYQYWQHEIFRLLECVALVGAEPVTNLPRLHVTDADRAEASTVIPAGSRLAVLHAGATDPRRHWGAENFARVGDALAAEGHTVVLIGTPGEAAQIDAVIAAMRHPARSLAGKLSLNGLVGLLDQAAVLVANDSGPHHLAEALDTPSVGIYWAGNMVNFGPTAVSRHRQLLSWRIHCPECGRDTIYDNCDHRPSFVDKVSVEQVLEQVWDVMAYARQAQP
jgi:ADP-heptose:LPS heptosyltransferase